MSATLKHGDAGVSRFAQRDDISLSSGKVWKCDKPSVGLRLEHVTKHSGWQDLQCRMCLVASGECDDCCHTQYCCTLRAKTALFPKNRLSDLKSSAFPYVYGALCVEGD